MYLSAVKSPAKKINPADKRQNPDWPYLPGNHTKPVGNRGPSHDASYGQVPQCVPGSDIKIENGMYVCTQVDPLDVAAFERSRKENEKLIARQAKIDLKKCPEGFEYSSAERLCVESRKVRTPCPPGFSIGVFDRKKRCIKNGFKRQFDNTAEEIAKFVLDGLADLGAGANYNVPYTQQCAPGDVTLSYGYDAWHPTLCRPGDPKPVAAPPPPPPPPAPVYNVTVSPVTQTQVSPQISPVFQQSYMPQNSPMSAGTTQQSATPQSAVTAPQQPDYEAMFSRLLEKQKPAPIIDTASLLDKQAKEYERLMDKLLERNTAAASPAPAPVLMTSAPAYSPPPPPSDPMPFKAMVSLDESSQTNTPIPLPVKSDKTGLYLAAGAAGLALIFFASQKKRKG